MLQNKIKVGEFDRRLVIEQNVPTTNSNTNEEIDSWSILSTVWAKRMLKGGREGFEADQQVASNVETYLIRYSTDVASVEAANFRVQESGDTLYYYVNLVEVDKRQGWIMLQAERKDHGQ